LRHSIRTPHPRARRTDPSTGANATTCTLDRTHDTGDCCKATNQPCAADSECCPGAACKFDLLMLKNVCK